MRTIALFARWPEPGRVKTRLSPALPSGLACQLQRAMLADSWAAAHAARAERRVIYWAGAPAGAARAALPDADAHHAAQGEGDLGARLDRAAAELSRDGATRVVVIGSDAPELTPACLDRALDALAESDLVLSPAPDGGYSLVGWSRPPRGLFAGISWSTPRVRDETEARARSLGLATTILEPVADVDTPADLVALIGRLLERPASAPATAGSLARLGFLPRPG